MAERSFVLAVCEGAYPSSVENIGKTLLALNGPQLHSGTREMEAVLHDILRGIRDKVLLKTSLEPGELEKLLKKHLRGDYKQCTVEWMTAG